MYPEYKANRKINEQDPEEVLYWENFHRQKRKIISLAKENLLNQFLQLIERRLEIPFVEAMKIPRQFEAYCSISINVCSTMKEEDTITHAKALSKERLGNMV